MILLIIGVALLLISWGIGTFIDEPGEGFSWGLALVAIGYVVSQMAGLMINTHQIPQHTETKIVSLQDGSQINGQFSGGLFVMRGSINEVEWFSYYKDNGNGSFSLDKQLASLSTIIPDATPETAHLSSSSVLTHCEKKWWSTWCSPDSGVYTHGDFHVPSNSIENNFVLDAK